MKKISMIIFSVILLTFVSCGKKQLKEGRYEGLSEADNGSSANVVLHINSEGKIENVEMILKDKYGRIKDENYGIESGEQNYKLAQRSVESSRQYPIKLVESQDIEKVDSIGGATTTHKSFTEAVKDALKKAK